MLYTELPLAAQTAFAQLQDATVAEYLSRSVAQLHGSFGKKSVKGKDYWYFVFREGTRHRQIYVGPDQKRVHTLIRAKETARPDQAETLARAYLAHGATTVLRKHLRLIMRLADFGFFRVGGILVGTHAFAAFANMLGVRWTSGDRTTDVDLAMPGKNVSIALPNAPQLDLHDVLSSFEAGFIPTHTFAGGLGPTYTLKGDPGFQLDFLTTTNRGGVAPRRIESLAVTAQPLKFLDFLLQAPVQTVMLDSAGHYAVVSIPEPARYAIHKLIVYGERGSRQRTKARKDIEQAAALLHWYAANDSRTIEQAWVEALGRGPGWRKRMRAGLDAVERRWPLQKTGLSLST